MDKDVVLEKESVVQLQVFHGFTKTMVNVTMTDYIELRICGHESTSNDDVPVSFYNTQLQTYTSVVLVFSVVVLFVD